MVHYCYLIIYARTLTSFFYRQGFVVRQAEHYKSSQHNKSKTCRAPLATDIMPSSYIDTGTDSFAPGTGAEKEGQMDAICCLHNCVRNHAE